MESVDAGIFFGRDASLIEALDTLRGMRETAAPRMLVILGASGAGKSSFLRAGLLPRLKRDDVHFFSLPILRPERGSISGDTGLVATLERACRTIGIETTRARIRSAVMAGPEEVQSLLSELAERLDRPFWGSSMPETRRPTLILPIDQAEELFTPEGQEEGEELLLLLRELLSKDAPPLIALFTIRSDNYERLQLARSLLQVRQRTMSLAPMPRGAYAEVIKGPAKKLEGSTRTLKIEDRLIEHLLSDIEDGAAKDALPLLAFTLERLYVEHGGDGDLTFTEYEQLGGIRGSIEAAIERALKLADADSSIPKDRQARLTLLRRGLIPWLADIDPDTGAPRRRVARLSEIPEETRPIINLLVEVRLLATDIAQGTGNRTIEAVREALLRQWSSLQGWLAEDAGQLAVIAGVRRACRDWVISGKSDAWLTHSAARLKVAEALKDRPQLSGSLEKNDWDYLGACHGAESSALVKRQRTQALFAALAVALLCFVGLGFSGFLDRAFLEGQVNWVRNTLREPSLKMGDVLTECSDFCPEMIVVPRGNFLMGSPVGVEDSESEQPQHTVKITRPLLISKFEITFNQWDACISERGCSYRPSDENWGRGHNAVANVNWGDVEQYLAWLSKKTGKTYRLLSEAEWEYAARAGSTHAYFWGDDIGEGHANCNGCQSEWDWKIRTSRLIRTELVGAL
jgi:hypothetical protein